MQRRHPDQIACLILESGPGTHEYLAGLRDLAHSYGALLIFDEMITGFRWSEAGAQRLYGVTPDLLTWLRSGSRRLGRAVSCGFVCGVG